MPVPFSAFTLKGGCKCGAVRYEFDFPEVDNRVLHPGLDWTFPFHACCSCNTCGPGRTLCAMLEDMDIDVLASSVPDRTKGETYKGSAKDLIGRGSQLPGT